MTGGWLTRSFADVPAHDDWLGPRERAVLARLHVAKRRADWRLGRWTAKAALAAWLGADADVFSVLAATDGAPEAWLAGIRLPASISISHRDGLALAAVASAPVVVGCDLEKLEPRSDAFVGDWLAPAEQALAGSDRVRLPNLMWTAKEAAAKVRRAGLRLDVRAAVTSVEDERREGWQRLAVHWSDEELVTRGWWRVEGSFVMTVAGAPELGPPVAL
jgi:4'-phosphopantetheinyl transferase